MGDMMHPDAPQDMSLIYQCIDDRISPVIEILISKIKEQETELSSVKQTLMQFLQMIYNQGMTSHKSNLMQKLTGSYGADLGPLDDFFSNTYGRKYSDDIIDEMIKHGIGDDDFDNFAKTYIDGAKGHWGKYLGGGMGGDGGIPGGAIAVKQVAGEEPEVTTGPEAADEAGNAMDAASKMMAALKPKRTKK